MLFADDAPAPPPAPSEPASRALPPRGAALLLLLVAALLLLRLGAVPLLGPDEPRYARVAVEMQRAGEWVRRRCRASPGSRSRRSTTGSRAPRSASLGETETAARLPAVLALLLLDGRDGARRRAALRRGRRPARGVRRWARACSRSPTAAPPAWTCCSPRCVTAATGLVGAARCSGSPDAPRCPPRACFVGLALLAKGPLGLLLPALVVGAFLLIARDRAAWDRLVRPAWMLALAAALCALVALPWYLAAWRAHGRDVRRRLPAEPQPPALHVHDPPPPRARRLLRARAARRALPVGGPRRPRRSVRRGRAARARTSSSSAGSLLPLRCSSRSRARSCPATSCPACRRSRSSSGRLADRLDADGRRGRWARGGAARPRARRPRVRVAPFVLRAQGEPRWRLLDPAGRLEPDRRVPVLAHGRPRRRAGAAPAARRRRGHCCCS